MQKKAKQLPEDALQIAVKRREAKDKGENKRYTHLSAEFQRIARRDKKDFLSDQCQVLIDNCKFKSESQKYEMYNSLISSNSQIDSDQYMFYY